MQTQEISTSTYITVYDITMSTKRTLNEAEVIDNQLIIDLEIPHFLNFVIDELEGTVRSDFHASVQVTYGSTHFRIKLKRILKNTLIVFIGYGGIVQSIETLERHSKILINFMDNVFNTNISPQDLYMFTRNPSELESLLWIIKKIEKFEDARNATSISAQAATKHKILSEIKDLYHKADQGVKCLILDSISEEFKYEFLSDRDNN